MCELDERRGRLGRRVVAYLSPPGLLCSAVLHELLL